MTLVVDASFALSPGEALDAPFATVDLRLARANGPTCTFLTPPV